MTEKEQPLKLSFRLGCKPPELELDDDLDQSGH